MGSIRPKYLQRHTKGPKHPQTTIKMFQRPSKRTTSNFLMAELPFSAPPGLDADTRGALPLPAAEWPMGRGCRARGRRPGGGHIAFHRHLCWKKVRVALVLYRIDTAQPEGSARKRQGSHSVGALCPLEGHRGCSGHASNGRAGEPRPRWPRGLAVPPHGGCAFAVARWPRSPDSPNLLRVVEGRPFGVE